jgi:hypothetical protein
MIITGIALKADVLRLCRGRLVNIYIKGRPRIIWDADDFGDPPRGPRDRDYYMPREYDYLGFFGGDTGPPRT